jgi:hypothetical protein
VVVFPNVPLTGTFGNTPIFSKHFFQSYRYRAGLSMPASASSQPSKQVMFGESLEGGVMYASSASERIWFWNVHAIIALTLVLQAEVRLMSMHGSTCAQERKWSVQGALFCESCSGFQRAEKLVFLKG